MCLGLGDGKGDEIEGLGLGVMCFAVCLAY